MFSELFVTKTPQSLPKTGRLKYFIPAWELITQDPWVLQVVQGYKIELVTVPVQQFQPHQPCLSSMQETVLNQG